MDHQFVRHVAQNYVFTTILNIIWKKLLSLLDWINAVGCRWLFNNDAMKKSLWFENSTHGSYQGWDVNDVIITYEVKHQMLLHIWLMSTLQVWRALRERRRWKCRLSLDCNARIWISLSKYVLPQKIMCTNLNYLTQCVRFLPIHWPLILLCFSILWTQFDYQDFSE